MKRSTERDRSREARSHQARSQEARAREAHETRRECRRSGFTLLEVLAAVAVLGLWFSILATVGIQGLRAEGTNERRIRASLLADGELANLEIQLADGLFPEDDELESSEDEFTILLTRTLLTEAELEQSDLNLVDLLVDEAENLMESLYLLRIDVTWIEGFDEQRVTRTTYAWDNTEFQDWVSQNANPGDSDENEDATREEREGGFDPDPESDDPKYKKYKKR